MALLLRAQFCLLLALDAAWRLHAESVIATLNADGFQTDLLAGEDAAIAAQRITAKYEEFEAEVVLKVAKEYAEQLKEVEDYKPPKELVLRTGGAYSRRADEFIKERKFPNAIADCLRGLMRPGLDSTASDVFMKKLEHALLRMQRIREMEAEEKAREDSKYVKENAEAAALAEQWKVVLAEDEQLWQTVDGSNSTGASSSTVDKPEILTLDVRSSPFSVREGQDASHATVEFCAANGIDTAGEFLSIHEEVQPLLVGKAYEEPNLKLDSPEEHLARGELHEDQLDFAAAAADYARGLMLGPRAGESEVRCKDDHPECGSWAGSGECKNNPTYMLVNCRASCGECKQEGADVQMQLDDRLSRALSVANASQLFLQRFKGLDYEGAVQAAASIPFDLRSDAAQLKVARCYVHLGKTKEAISSLTSLINRCDKSGSWQKNEPRTMASVLGAVLALRLGDTERAKKMYQLVLRADPDQQFVNKRYKVLRSYMKMLTDTEELVKASKNHDVVKAVERLRSLLEQVVGVKGAMKAGTRLLLFECKSKSAMGYHDDAIESCNVAIKHFEDHDNPDPRRIAEAYAWRAEANLRDRSYDDAVSDLQTALKKVPNSGDYEEKLNEAKRLQSEWNESEEQHDPRTHEKMGHFYSNRPSKELLDLPENVEDLDREERCKRLKNGFRKMSLRWHPDKAKGGKARAQRKSAELGEAKGLLELQWGCKGRRGRR